MLVAMLLSSLSLSEPLDEEEESSLEEEELSIPTFCLFGSGVGLLLGIGLISDNCSCPSSIPIRGIEAPTIEEAGIKLADTELLGCEWLLLVLL